MPFIKEDPTQGPEPIAIVGMSCRLPGSISSPRTFWDLLRSKSSVRTPVVPTSRFNISAHHHPDLARPGSFPSLGGYFLDEDPVDFDPTFFSMTPVEAAWLDPQHRKLLEVCYEVFENAGLTLDQVAGSNTGVYAATFTSDYQQMTMLERDFRHNYAATGVDTGILSARINNAFNLLGPSSVINTACSSALYAIHNACQALRNGDCDAAVAAGSNIIMMVDQHMNTAKLGVLSPTSECHTFDESADGYGRGEGVGALYLKRVSDAIRDKDLIRGVIRTSATNTNGKVPGMGITFPNEQGQERVLRFAYERANLDPNKTAYVECHGTGTPTGDPIEVRAVGRGMNDTRSRGKPIILGAVKANIGHSEAASGIFATMKAALMTEKGGIPGVHGLNKVNPNIKDKEWNVHIARDWMPWPEGFDVRRASVSSFGYGGTNAHLVVEAVESLCPYYEHGQPKAAAKYTYDPAYLDRPFLITMSAHDQKTLTRNIAAHQSIAEEYYLPDLAYTLNERRTQFDEARGYAIAWPGCEREALGSSSFTYGSSTKSIQSSIGFVMTGQGAQWARMGYEATRRYPQFNKTIAALDRVLHRAVNLEDRPSWTLTQVLEAPAESSLPDRPDVSQPACTAIQIAIIDLFVSWGIKPSVTVGHSSGEIAAAYGSGRISAPEAILAAYLRGLAVARAAPAGTMLAVGLGVDQVQKYIDLLPPDAVDRACIACENSPSSTTLSGTEVDILAVKKIMDDSGVFARQLRTGRAYHSSHMDAVAPLYEQLYAQAQDNLTEGDLSWRQATVRMVSSVTGSGVDESPGSIGISYWCDNLRSRVRFDTAVQSLCRNPDLANVKVLVEIGPHTALKGPLAQIMAENSFDVGYVGSLVRGKDDAVSLLRTAGELYLRGVSLKFDAINHLHTRSISALSLKNGTQSQARCLVDLPPYQWNYDRRHWYEPRAVADLRKSKHPRHDLLGRRIFGLSSNAPTWKNILRQRDVPWFADHMLGSDVIFPAAGHVSMAIEAFMQQLGLEPAQAGGVKLAGIDIRKALVVPDSDDGIEVHTRLEKDISDDDWYIFTVESVSKHEGSDLWTLHSTGRIRRAPSLEQQVSRECPYKSIQLHQRVSPKRWYRAFERLGFHYGPSFQTMTRHVRANGRDRWASAVIKVQTRLNELESRHMLHPSTIDGCLHAVLAAVHRGLLKEMPWGLVPLAFEEISICFPDVDRDDGQCFAWAEEDVTSSRHFMGHVQLFSGDTSSSCFMDIRGMRIVSYEAALPPTLAGPPNREPYSRVEWREWDIVQKCLRGGMLRHTEKDGTVAVLLANQDEGTGTPALYSALGGNATLLSTATLDSLQEYDTVVIDDAEGSVLARATETSWTCLQMVLIKLDKPVVWVTRGANEGHSVDSGLPQGFLRAVRSEAHKARICLIDADREASTDDIAALVKYMGGVLGGGGIEGTTRTAGQGDVECWLTKDGRVLVPRLESHTALNNQIAERDGYNTEVRSADKSSNGTLAGEPPALRAQFRPDSAYLLVGCLGGLGRSITTWMLERGCKNFIFLSRSGTAKPEAIEVVSRLTASGASVEVFSVDASDELAVADVVQSVSRRQSIRGVIHAAMVLQDGLYENMSFSAYQAALRPKMYGAIALDKALADSDLDFFLMTSSISAVLGNPGQTNYSAGNSYLDYLALQRRRRGLAACSMALPAVDDVGVVAENTAVAESLARKMPFGINEKEMLAAFELAIVNGRPSPVDGGRVSIGDVQLVVGLEPDAMVQAIQDENLDFSDAFWYRDARMSSVRASIEAKQKEKGANNCGQGSDRSSFVATLNGRPQDKMVKALGMHIVQRAARILGSERDAFQLEGRSVGNHGVDSMIGVELQRWLFSEFGLQISINTLSDPKTTFAGLARMVAKHLGLLAVEEDPSC